MKSYKVEELVFWRCPKCRKFEAHQVILKSNNYKLRCCKCKNFIRKQFNKNKIVELRQKYLIKRTLDLSKKYDKLEEKELEDNLSFFSAKKILKEEAKKYEFNKRRNCFYLYLNRNSNLYSLAISKGYTIDKLIGILKNRKYTKSKIIFNKVNKKLNRFKDNKIVELYGGLENRSLKPIIFIDKSLLEANQILYDIENDSNIYKKYRFVNQIIKLKTRTIDAYILLDGDIYSARDKIIELKDIQDSYVIKSHERFADYKLKRTGINN